MAGLTGKGATGSMQLRRRWLLAGSLPACVFLLGLLETDPDRLRDTDSLFSTCMAVLLVLLVFWWYRTDASDRGYRTSWGLNTAMVLLTAFALPWYLVRSRSGLQIPLALLCATGLFVLCGLLYGLGSAIAGGS
jgi:hypothetical protein